MSSIAELPNEIPPAVRQGTKSCTECRNRKVRCVWPTEGATTCQGCLARRKTCEVQARMIRTRDTVSGTSRARVKHLEDEVSSLWNVVRQLEARVNSGEHSQVPLPIENVPHRPSVSSNNVPSHNDEESDSEASEISTTNTPRHLLNLFDNGLLDSEPRGSESKKTSRSHPSVKHLQNIAILRNLMPNREVMVKVVTFASPWLSIYNLLFLQTNLMRTSEQLLTRYDNLSVSNPDILELASLLLAVALTVQQSPDEFRGDARDRISNTSYFIGEVNELFERIVVNDDILAGTLDGISITLLYLRLQLSLSSVSKMWLTLRRVVALAELNGLPQAVSALTKHNASSFGAQGGAMASANPSKVASWRDKAEAWASICAIDRIQSLMWSLPLATANYPLPKRPIVDANGQVDAQAYQYSIVEVATKIIEIDNLAQVGRPLEEVFQVVIEADQQMRAVDNLTPKGWQRIEWSEFSIYAMLQYWQQYIIVRIHLQLALKYDGRDFAFNFVTCLGAAQELTKRYIFLRPLLAPGFFANRVLDLQAFTGMAFLLLAVCRCSYSSMSFFHTVDTDGILTLVDKAVDTMRFAAARVPADFARQAADSICSLQSLLTQPQNSENQKITLHLALIGTIHVSRKARPTDNIQPNLEPSQVPDLSWQPTMSGVGLSHDQPPLFDPSINDLMDSLSYSMEFPESYPLFADQTSGSEPWLTWSGWDGNS